MKNLIILLITISSFNLYSQISFYDNDIIINIQNLQGGCEYNVQVGEYRNDSLFVTVYYDSNIKCVSDVLDTIEIKNSITNYTLELKLIDIHNVLPTQYYYNIQTNIINLNKNKQAPYPNPSYGKINWENEFKVYDINGKFITFAVDEVDLNAGVYIFRKEDAGFVVVVY